MKKQHIISIGIVVTVVIALLIFGLSFLKGKNIFVKENVFYAIYEKIDGLTVGSPVTISGYKVGQVREIAFHSDNSGRLLVKLALKAKHNIRKDAKAELYSSDLMGTKAIQLIHGVSEKTHALGDTLNGQIEGELIDMVSTTMLPIKIKTESLLSSVDSILTVVRYIFNKNTQENLSKSFANINKTIKNLEFATSEINSMIVKEKAKVGTILTNIESITTNLNNNGELISRAMANFEALSDSLKTSEIKSTIHNANSTLVQLNEIMTRINNGEGSLGEFLHNDTLYTHLQSTAYNLNRLVRDLHDNPKRYIHFSAFDLGKTVIVQEGKDKNNKKRKKKEKKEEQEQKD